MSLSLSFSFCFYFFCIVLQTHANHVIRITKFSLKSQNGKKGNVPFFCMWPVYHKILFTFFFEKKNSCTEKLSWIVCSIFKLLFFFIVFICAEKRGKRLLWAMILFYECVCVYVCLTSHTRSREFNASKEKIALLKCDFVIYKLNFKCKFLHTRVNHLTIHCLHIICR